MINKFSHHVAMMLLVCFWGCAWGSLVEAQPVPSEWDKIRSAIVKRREKFRFFSCKLETAKTLPKNIVPDAKPTDPADPDGPFVLIGERSIEVDIDTGSYHEIDTAPIYNDSSNTFILRVREHICDGDNWSRYYPTHDTFSFTGKGPFDLIVNKAIDGAQSFAYGPVFWSFGIFSQKDFVPHQITDLSELGFQFREEEGHVFATGSIYQFQVTFVFDATKDYSVINAEFRHRGHARRGDIYSVEYKLVEDEWIVSNWQKHTEQYGEMSQVVHEFQSHENIDPSRFTVTTNKLEPGMVYVDAIENNKYRIQNDGEPVPFVVEASIPVESKQGIYVWLMTANLCVITMIFVLIWRKKRISKINNHNQPEN